MQNIEFGSVSSGRYPDPAENASIEAIPDPEYRIGAPLINRTQRTFWMLNGGWQTDAAERSLRELDLNIHLYPQIKLWNSFRALEI